MIFAFVSGAKRSLAEAILKIGMFVDETTGTSFHAPDRSLCMECKIERWETPKAAQPPLDLP